MKRLGLIGRLLPVLAVLTLIASCSDGGNGEVSLIPVKLDKDSHWSMINQDGQIVYEDAFKERPTLCYNGVFSVEEGDGITVYTDEDENNPQVLGECENLKCAGFMQRGLMPITFPNERISIIDKNGKKKFELKPYEGKEIIRCNPGYSTDGLLCVELADGKRGFVDTKGEMVIKPQYDIVYNYYNGIAIVGIDKSDGGRQYSLIDSKGETLLKLKDSYDDIEPFIMGKSIIVKQGDRMLVVNTNGEETRLPSKVKDVIACSDKYIIFRDDEVGVATLDGEIIIRPRYESINFGSDNTFIAQKAGNDEVEILNDKAETVMKLDYSKAEEFADFGYFAQDGKIIVLLDKEGKPKSNEEYYEVSNHIAEGSVKSDYFNISEIAQQLATLVTTDLPKQYPFGSAINKVCKGEDPSTSYYINDQIRFSSDVFSGPSYSSYGMLAFDDNVTSYNSNYDRIWNPTARLQAIVVTLTVSKDWGKEGHTAVVKALEKKGYKVTDTNIVDSMDDDTYSWLSNGKYKILVQTNEGETVFNISVADGAPQAADTDNLDDELAEIAAAKEPVQQAITSAADYSALVSNRLTAADLQGYSKKDLRIIRNTIYALHGMRFKSKDLQAHFGKIAWYSPSVDVVPASKLSAIEKANIALIQKLEK